MPRKYDNAWTCTVAIKGELPDAADYPMRVAVNRAVAASAEEHKQLLLPVVNRVQAVEDKTAAGCDK